MARLIIALFLFTALTAGSPGTGHAAPSPQQYAAMLKKGLDVDWSKTRKGSKTFSEQTVKDFKDAGFSHVRIRIKDPISDKLLKNLDQQVGYCIDNGLIPVLAYQAKKFKKDPSDRNIEQVVNWWRVISEHFSQASPLVSFDVLIEATDAVNKQPERLNILYEKAVSAIRGSNPTRIVFISPRLRSDPAYLDELKIPSKHNNYLMAEWHFYAAGPSKQSDNKRWTTGTAAEKKIILDKIQLAKEWEKKTGIPTWVGAWMPSNYNDGNQYTINEQVVFARFVASELDKAGIPFSVNSDSKFYDREKKSWIDPMRPVVEAILHPDA